MAIIHSDTVVISSLDSFDKNSLIIGLESTAHYGNNLVEFLVSKHFKVCVINPIQTSTMRKINIRKTKTDKVDTFITAKTLMIQPHRFYTVQDIDLMHLKNLGRFRQKIVKQRTRLKIQLTSYMDQVFPEFQYFFFCMITLSSIYSFQIIPLTYLETWHLLDSPTIYRPSPQQKKSQPRRIRTNHYERRRWDSKSCMIVISTGVKLCFWRRRSRKMTYVVILTFTGLHRRVS